MIKEDEKSENRTLISYRLDNSLAIVTISSPPVNSVTPQMIDELESVFNELLGLNDVRVVILASSLEKIFVAGFDIQQFVTWRRKDALDVTRRGHDVLMQISSFPKPVICAINGIAFGGGLELALACDFRVMDPRAKVGLPEVGLGIIPGYGGTQRLPRLIGPAMAKKLIFTGDAIDAQEAYRIGLVQNVSEPNACIEEAIIIGRRICEKAPIAITYAKKAVDSSTSMDLAEGITFEINSVGDLAETRDKTEGAIAFLEKRPPEFKGF